MKIKDYTWIKDLLVLSFSSNWKSNSIEEELHSRFTSFVCELLYTIFHIYSSEINSFYKIRKFKNLSKFIENKSWRRFVCAAFVAYRASLLANKTTHLETTHACTNKLWSCPSTIILTYHSPSLHWSPLPPLSPCGCMIRAYKQCDSRKPHITRWTGRSGQLTRSHGFKTCFAQDYASGWRELPNEPCGGV